MLHFLSCEDQLSEDLDQKALWTPGMKNHNVFRNIGEQLQHKGVSPWTHPGVCPLQLWNSQLVGLVFLKLCQDLSVSCFLWTADLPAEASASKASTDTNVLVTAEMSLLHINVLSSSTYQPGSARAQSMMGYLAVGDTVTWRTELTLSPPPQLKDALGGGGPSWPGQPTNPMWPGTTAPPLTRLRPHTEGWSQVCLCQQVNLLLATPGQEAPLEVGVGCLVPTFLDLQDLDPELVRR